jgi:dihydroorotate dehydrogenase
LIPLIAHDRAGFGGGLFSSGVLVLLITLHARPSPHLLQALALAGSTGFVCAISVHFCIGYLVFSHIAPAFAGAALFVAGLILTFRDSFFTEKTLLEEN